eukprot:TRINITY_DN6011_c0_g1_i3.p2 TRINITY_DN6011_c0_g1~~TRINITY_DN6011_c0_g1_i3.p2  ORF type:complete len:1556 (-),score=282.00 TRINITY_DN6011_c0_g1_i3:204-4871(-)
MLCVSANTLILLHPLTKYIHTTQDGQTPWRVNLQPRLGGDFALDHPQDFKRAYLKLQTFALPLLRPSLSSMGLQTSAEMIEELPSFYGSLMQEIQSNLHQLVLQETVDKLRWAPMSQPILNQAIDCLRALPDNMVVTTEVPIRFVYPSESTPEYVKEFEQLSANLLQHFGNTYFICQGTQPALPFWLICILRDDHLSILSQRWDSIDDPSNHTSKASCPETLSKVISISERACQKANQLTLLLHLYEELQASPYLIAEVDAISSQQGTAKVLSEFTLGQFACPCVHVIKLSLYNRLQFNFALQTLKENASLLTISNLPTMFVFKEAKDAIFYMTFVEDKVEDQISGVLSLRIYGVQQPDERSIHNLHKMLESKLDSSATLLLSTLVSKNRQTKLSRADIEFLKPPGTYPVMSSTFRLPRIVEDVGLFMTLVKQNLLKQLLPLIYSETGESQASETESPASRPDTGDAQQSKQSASELLHAVGSFDSGGLGENREMVAFKLKEFMYLYNCVPNSKVPSQFFSIVGSGMACIFIYLVDKNGHTIRWIPTAKPSHDKRYQITPDNLSVVHISDDISTSDETPSGMVSDAADCKIRVDLWQRGSVNMRALMEFLRMTFNRSSCEYVLETNLLLDITPVGQFYARLWEPSFQLMEYSTSIGVPSVSTLKASVFLPTWAVKNFVTEFLELFSESNGGQAPYVFTKQEHSNSLQLMPPSGVAKVSLPEGYAHCNNLPDFIIFSGAVIGDVATDPSLSPGATSLNPNSVYNQLEEMSWKPDSENLYHNRTSRPDSSKLAVYRRSASLVQIRNDSVRLYCYNWNVETYEKFTENISRLVSWINLKYQMVANVILLKLGYSYNMSSFVEAPRGIIPCSKILPSASPLSASYPTSVYMATRYFIENMEDIISNTAPQRQPPKKEASNWSKLATQGRQASMSQSNRNVKKRQVGPADYSRYIRLLLPSVSLDSGEDKPHLDLPRYFSSQLKQIQSRPAMEDSVFTSPNREGLKGVPTSRIILTPIRQGFLLHTNRMPFLINPLRSRVMPKNEMSIVDVPDFVIESSDRDGKQEDVRDAAQVASYKQLLVNLLEEYAQHLISANGEPTSVKYIPATENTEGFAPSDIFSIGKVFVNGQVKEFQIPKVFLHQVYDGSCLVYELGCEDIFLYCNIYAYSVTNKKTKASSFHNPEFRAACQVVRDNLHLGSFLYNHHLVLFINQIESLISGTGDTQVYDFELISAMKDFTRFFHEIPSHTRNVMATDQFTLDCQHFLPTDMLGFLQANCLKYGFQNLGAGILVIREVSAAACAQIGLTSDAHECTLVLHFPEALELDIKRLESGNTLICDVYMIYSRGTTSVQEQRNLFLNNYVEEVLLQVAHDFEKDYLWSKVVRGYGAPSNQLQNQIQMSIIPQEIAADILMFPSNVPFLMNAKETKRFLDLVHLRRLHSLDPRLEYFSSLSINWNSFFFHLASLTPLRVRRVDSDDFRKHLLMIFCENDTDFAIMVKVEGHVSSLYACWKENNEAENKASSVDYVHEHHKRTQWHSHHVSEFINNLCHWMWRCCLSDT